MAAPVLRQPPASLDIRRTKSARRPGDSTSSMLPREKPRNRKRSRDQSASEDINEQSSAKRRKAASHNYPPEFWNALSKITLTRRALKEFDRRTTEEKGTPVGAAKRLTRLLRSDTKKLLRFARNGGPNLSHLRGYAELPRSVANMSRSSSRKGKRTRDSGLPTSDFTAKTSTTGPYNSQFQQMLTDIGVFPDGYEDLDGNIQEPANIDSLRELLPNSRSSLSPSRFTNHEFKQFQRANRRAKSELKAMSSVVPIITGAKDNRFETEENKVFNNVETFAPDLKMAQPDKYCGARPEQIDERVRRDLGKYIVPSTSTTLPVLPNFFFEGKSAAGRPDVAQRQVMHDNAYGARAMFQLQNYRKDTPVYDDNAYTIGSYYSHGALTIYATHPKQSATGGTEYYMTQLGGYKMTGDIETFRRGATAFRNSRDFTQEQRDRFITEANFIARSVSTDVSSSRTNSRTGISFAMANGSFGSETSADELALHHDPASDNSDGKARPHKRTTQAATSGARLRSAFNIEARDFTTQETRRQPRDGAHRSNGSDDNRHVTADGEQNEDEGDDNFHTTIHSRSIPDEAALALQRSRSARARWLDC